MLRNRNRQARRFEAKKDRQLKRQVKAFMRKMAGRPAQPARLPPIKAAKDTPKAFRITAAGALKITAAEPGTDGGKPKLATFEGNAYTGAPMRPAGWWNDLVIDLDGVKPASQTRPVLRQHDHQQVLGHTTKIEVTDDGVMIAGVLSGEPQHTDKVTVPAANGFPWQMSVGADPVRTEFLEAGETTEVNGRDVTGPMTISRETVLGEFSFVPLGADDETSAEITASRGNLMDPKLLLKGMMAQLRGMGAIAAAKYSDEAIDKMDADEARAALKKCMNAGDDSTADDDDDDDDDEEDKPKSKAKAKRRQARIQAEAKEIVAAAVAESRKAITAEMSRTNTIKAMVEKYGVREIEIEEGGAKKKVDLAVHAAANGWSEGDVALHLIRGGRPDQSVGVPGGLGFSKSTPVATEAVIEAAIFQAAKHQFRLNDDGFYLDPTPDGKGTFRRVPQHIQAEAQSGLKARYTDQVQQHAHDLFKDGSRIGPKQIFAMFFRANNYHRQVDLNSEAGCRYALEAWDYLEKHARHSGIEAEGASNVSISNILANVMNKFALQGYLYVEQAWREICAIRPVNDFKATKSINLLGDVMFKALGPTGELENASVGDQAFANQAQPFGRILTMPWTHIVNDDLGMLTGVPLKIGQGAGLALNDNVWALAKALAAGTVNGDDGVTFFRTTSLTTDAAKRAGTAYLPNKQSGAGSVFGDAGLKAAKALFDNQIDPNGNPLGFDGMTPVLLHGPSLWRDVTAQMQAAAIVYGGATAALAANANVWQGRMKPVMSRYIENAKYVNSTTAWWLLFDPVTLAMIEVCFLNGVDTPSVLQAGPDYQFDRPGITVRGTMPFGSNQQNFRGGVYSVGA